MNRPDDVSAEAWETAKAVFDRVYDACPDLEGGCETDIVTECARAIDAAIEKERERISEEVTRVIDTLPTEGTVAQALRTATAIDRIFAAIRKGA